MGPPPKVSRVNSLPGSIVLFDLLALHCLHCLHCWYSMNRNLSNSYNAAAQPLLSLLASVVKFDWQT